MEQYHRKLINKHMSELVHVTFDLKQIVHILLERVVINEWMKNYILGDEGQACNTTKLYELIQGRGPEAFTALCKVLKETGNLKALDILTLTKTSDEDEDQISLLDTEFNKIIIEHDDSYVTFHPERILMENCQGNSHNGAYPMGSNPKGHALILNINNIKHKKERLGSGVDMENLKKLFKGLGYIVHPKVDLTERQIKNVINEFINICVSEKANSTVVFLMSHGEAGKDPTRSVDIVAADGITINTDWIIGQFIHKDLTKDIPKLFFIQACRGDNSDFGWENYDGENNRSENDSTNISPSRTSTIRQYKDVYIAYATIPGFTAKRDPVDGSWFVQKFCEVIRKNAYNTDLMGLMQMVDMEVEKLSSDIYGLQTVECTTRGFNKRLYFNPGVYYDNADHINVMNTSTNPTDD